MLRCFGMVKPPKKPEAPEGDPKRGDEILRRMLQSKPKQHSEIVKERHKAKPKRAKADK
jgi:hypothetical protein